MTANAMHGDREKGLEAGMNDYLSKSSAPQVLVEALEKWLETEDEGNRPGVEKANQAVESPAASCFAIQRTSTSTISIGKPRKLKLQPQRVTRSRQLSNGSCC
jgi:DNA-binding NarL/FixJ family response regulator